MKFRNAKLKSDDRNQDDGFVLRMSIAWKGAWGKLSGGMEIVCILTGELVTQVYLYIKIHWIVPLNLSLYVNFTSVFKSEKDEGEKDFHNEKKNEIMKRRK